MPIAPKSGFVNRIKHVGVLILGVVVSSGFVGLLTYTGYYLISTQQDLLVIFYSILVGTFIYLAGLMVYKRLRHVEQVKSEFLTVAAHNLRTPLTKIQWLISDVSERIDNDEAKKRFNDMQTTFKSLTNMINRFLEISEAGQTSVYFSYMFEPQHLEYVVLQAVANLRFGIEKKNIAVSTRIQQDLPSVYIDKERMQLAINVLIENAVLYNKQNGTIEIEITRDKNNVSCSVADSGIGISKEDLPKIFTKFFRSKEATSVDTDRVGLELSLAKEIIEQHGGKIFVESKGKGRGSRFWFTLPISKSEKKE